MEQALPINRAPRPMRAAAPRASIMPAISTVLPLASLFYSFLIFSPEVAINLVGINLPAYRITLFLLAIPSVVILSKRTGGRPNFIDIAVGLASFWILVSFVVTYGSQEGLVRGGGIVVDTALSYLVGRASIARLNDVRMLLMVLLPGLMFAGFFLVMESLSGSLLLRPTFASLFGTVSSSVTDGGTATRLVTETRLGLLRAYGPFAHPILAGVFMISFLPLFYFSGLRSWPFYAGLAVALTGFFSLSSATFLCLMVAIGAISIDHFKQYFPKLTWWTITSMMSVAVFVAHFASQNGIVSVLSRLTLTPHTAQYRVLIWEYGLQTIELHPWFGIGYRSWERLWWMHDSVDAHFLLLGMRHGVLVPVLLVLAIVYGVIRLGFLAPRLKRADRNLLIGVNVSIILLFLVGQTVAFFGSGTIGFMAFLAILAGVLGSAQTQVKKDRMIAQLIARRAQSMQRQAGVTPIANHRPASPSQ